MSLLLGSAPCTRYNPAVLSIHVPRWCFTSNIPRTLGTEVVRINRASYIPANWEIRFCAHGSQSIRLIFRNFGGKNSRGEIQPKAMRRWLVSSHIECNDDVSRFLEAVFPWSNREMAETRETEHHSCKGTAAAKCRMVLRQLSYKHTLQPAFPSCSFFFSFTTTTTLLFFSFSLLFFRESTTSF